MYNLVNNVCTVFTAKTCVTRTCHLRLCIEAPKISPCNKFINILHNRIEWGCVTWTERESFATSVGWYDNEPVVMHVIRPTLEFRINDSNSTEIPWRTRHRFRQLLFSISHVVAKYFCWRKHEFTRYSSFGFIQVCFSLSLLYYKIWLNYFTNFSNPKKSRQIFAETHK